MSALLPFRALRPAPEVASRVASVPYDVVNTDEARALVGRRAAELPARHAIGDRSAAGHAAVRRPRVRDGACANLAELRRAAPMMQDAEPSLYVYRLRMGRHEQTGVAGLFSVDEYERGLDQEAREDAQGQGRRPHAAHRRDSARRRASSF